MRDIKRITIDHKGLPFFDEDGVYVSYEDCAKIIEDLNNTENDEIDANCQISDLKRQLNALAAENAKLKGYIDDECYIANPIGMDYIGAYSSSAETPATDAYLNALRAEGLKMAIDHMNNQTSDNCADVTVLPVIEMYNQLRAGEPS